MISDEELEKNFAEEKLYKKKYGFKDSLDYSYKAKKGLREETVKEISRIKKEPEWMLEKRLLAYKIFKEKELPKWGCDLSEIDFNNIYYYLRPIEGKAQDNWNKVPKEIKDTFDKLGVPEAERRMFAGGEAQYDSEVIYSHIRKELEAQGVIFTSTDEAIAKYPELVKKYFGTVVPSNDNKFAALNTAVWSGGSFIYVPKNTKLTMPLQAYFRINAENAGQFERTLIIADEGSDVTYIEGCTAPIYISSSLHAAVVEIIAHKNAHVKYVTIQNWSKNVYNLVTQRAHAYEGAHVEWIDGNIGSKVNMKYPSIFLKGEGSRGEVLSIALAGPKQEQDTGGKIYHLAPNTSSKLISKSISKDNGISSFRGLIYVDKNAANSSSYMRCDALLIDNNSKSNTYPYIDVHRNDTLVSHEASIGKINEEELFYLISRGIKEDDAIAIIILGFIEPLTNTIPLEYSLELKRLIKFDTAKAIA
jgi:Fe-S cluster assembly protein SufB